MKRRTSLLALAITITVISSLFGCSQLAKDKPNFSGYRDVAELATLECYYHNVAEIYNPGKTFGPFHTGEKKAWFEYRGSVTIGIDVSRVVISEPDKDGVVTISLPQAEIMGMPDVDETSFSDMYADTGFLASITAEEQTAALAAAQNAMLEQAENDESLRNQATERAKILLEEYVIHVGEALGQTYTVRFEMLPEE